MDESEEEIKRLQDARRKGGILPIGNKVPAPPVAAPASSIKFTKGWTPQQQAMHAKGLEAALRKRDQEDKGYEY